VNVVDDHGSYDFAAVRPLRQATCMLGNRGNVVPDLVCRRVRAVDQVRVRHHLRTANNRHPLSSVATLVRGMRCSHRREADN
jgi:hypothetical protein